jgi:hypothetical protein
VSDLDRLRDLGQRLSQPAFDELVDTRRRRTRQSRLVSAAALGVAVVTAIGVLSATGQAKRTEHPATNQSQTPTPTPNITFEVPAGQQTIVPDVGPDGIRGYDTLAILTNTQPEHLGVTQLSTTVATRAGLAFVQVYCRGSDDLMYIYEREDGASGIGSCAPDADTTLTPGYDIPDEVVSESAVALSMTMWVARPSAAWLDCWHQGTSDCNALYGVPTGIAEPPAEFGFAVFEHRPAPALELFQRSYDAVSTIRHVAWVIDRAVTAAPDAGRLAFELPASGEGYVVDVYQAQSRHFEQCRQVHRDELPDYETTQSSDYWAAVDEVCGTTLRLVVDGVPVGPDNRDAVKKGHFTALGAVVEADVVHRIEVEVVRGDPRHVRFAVIVRKRGEIPQTAR